MLWMLYVEFVLVLLCGGHVETVGSQKIGNASVIPIGTLADREVFFHFRIGAI